MKATSKSRHNKVKVSIELEHYIDLMVFKEEQERAIAESKYYDNLYSNKEECEYMEDEIALLTVKRYEKAKQQYERLTTLLDTCHCLPDEERAYYEGERVQAALVIDEEEDNLVYRYCGVMSHRKPDVSKWVFTD